MPEAVVVPAPRTGSARPSRPAVGPLAAAGRGRRGLEQHGRVADEQRGEHVGVGRPPRFRCCPVPGRRISAAQFAGVDQVAVVAERQADRAGGAEGFGWALAQFEAPVVAYLQVAQPRCGRGARSGRASVEIPGRQAPSRLCTMCGWPSLTAMPADSCPVLQRVQAVVGDFWPRLRFGAAHARHARRRLVAAGSS